MTDYFAFLRGINVGGKNSIKMEDLRQIFADCGCSNVKSYIQSGNLVFQYKKTNAEELRQKLESKIKKDIGNAIPVVLRTREELDNIVKLDPFKNAAVKGSSKFYIVFLSEKPALNIELPMISEKDGLNVLSVINDNAFVLSFEIKGRNGFPNNFIEKKLGVAATSRYWNTVLKMMELDPKT